MASGPDIDAEINTPNRVCTECRQSYSIERNRRSFAEYFDRPYDYRTGCETYCLHCWLGVPPDAEGEEDRS
jgi:hypothetical protein